MVKSLTENQGFKNKVSSLKNERCKFPKNIKNFTRIMSFRTKEESHPRHKESRQTENVLVLQGGGSLGAFACGVFKALVKKNIRIDIAAGTSIGAVNAAIIVGSKSDHPEKDLEEFWIEVAESNYKIIPDIYLIDYDSRLC
jgi:NTE family protein